MARGMELTATEWGVDVEEVEVDGEGVEYNNEVGDWS